MAGNSYLLKGIKFDLQPAVAITNQLLTYLSSVDRQMAVIPQLSDTTNVQIIVDTFNWLADASNQLHMVYVGAGNFLIGKVFDATNESSLAGVSVADIGNQESFNSTRFYMLLAAWHLDYHMLPHDVHFTTYLINIE